MRAWKKTLLWFYISCTYTQIKNPCRKTFLLPRYIFFEVLHQEERFKDARRQESYLQASSELYSSFPNPTSHQVQSSSEVTFWSSLQSRGAWLCFIGTQGFPCTGWATDTKSSCKKPTQKLYLPHAAPALGRGWEVSMGEDDLQSWGAGWRAQAVLRLRGPTFRGRYCPARKAVGKFGKGS